jgi:hypothetical protein
MHKRIIPTLFFAGICLSAIVVMGQGPPGPFRTGIPKRTPTGWTQAKAGTDYLAPGVAPSSDVTMGGHKITNLATPTLPTDAPTKAYVDARVGGNPGVIVVQPGRNGVVGNGTTDDAVAIQGIIDANPGRIIHIVSTNTAAGYYLGRSLTLSTAGQILQGDGSGPQSGTVLTFAPGVTGVLLNAAYCGVRDISLNGSEKWITGYSQCVLPGRNNPARWPAGVTRSAGASDADGVKLKRAFCWVRNVSCVGFGRDGINASYEDNLPDPAFPDDALIDGCFLGNNRGNGLTINGMDSNVIETRATTLWNNHIWGINTSPQLCGHFSSPQATQNHSDVVQYKLNYACKAAVAKLARSSNTVTLTWAAPFTAIPLVPGDAICITRCDPDPSFVGRWRIRTVTNGGGGNCLSLTYTQVAPNATATAAGSNIVGLAGRLSPDGTIVAARRDATPATVTATGNTVKSSAVITGMSTTAGIQAGARSGWTSIGGAAMWADQNWNAFPPDTRVVSVDSATRITVSKPAKVTSTGVRLEFGFPWAPLNTTAVTFSAAYRSNEVNMPVVPFRVGQGITLLNCSDNTFSNPSTNQGTFIVLSVSADRKTVCFAQSGAPASYPSGLAWVGRMALPTDTWRAAGLRGGAYSATGAAVILWHAPYIEGGQGSYFSWSNRLMVAEFGIGPPDDRNANVRAFLPSPFYGADDFGGWYQLPVASYMSNISGEVISVPPNYVTEYDLDQSQLIRLGTAACHSLTTTYQDPTVGGFPALWKQAWSKPALLWANGSGLNRIAVNAASTTDLASEGAAAVTVNAAAGTGTGGLVVGNGAGATVFGAAPNGVTLPTLTDAQAANGTIYLGSDHGGKLCRKDGAGTVHVMMETP